MNTDDVPLVSQIQTSPEQSAPLPQRKFIYDHGNRAMRGCRGIRVTVSPKANAILKLLFQRTQENSTKLWESKELGAKLNYALGTIYNGITELNNAFQRACRSCITIENIKIDNEGRGYRLKIHIHCTIIQPPGKFTLPSEPPELV